MTWTVIDADGTSCGRWSPTRRPRPARATRSWDGRDDEGAFVPRGTYRAQVRATDGTHVAVQRVAVVADAFRFVLSDSTPARGQRITVTVVTAETLSKNPRITIYQPGIGSWSVSTTKSTSTAYKATVTLRSSSSGTMRIRASGYDANGRSQGASVSFPLH